MSHAAKVSRADASSASGFARVRQLLATYFPLLPPAYVLSIACFGELRLEHGLLVAVVAVLWAFGERTRALLSDLSPYILVLIGYDLVRYLRPIFVTAERVWACGLRDLELATFAVAPGVTLQDWFQLHHAPFWDLLFAVPYTIFAYLALVYSAYLYFKDRPRMRHYLWAFAIANFASFVIWLALPAAPPWHIRAHGCTVDAAALPNAAGLVRVDELLGISYFQNFYARASSVFGAMPSMHCAYPMIGLLTAWRHIGWKTKPLHVTYTLAMLVASNYLDHHYLWDGVAGFALAGVSVWAAGRLLGREKPVQRPQALAMETA